MGTVTVGAQCVHTVYLSLLFVLYSGDHPAFASTFSLRVSFHGS